MPHVPFARQRDPLQKADEAQQNLFRRGRRVPSKIPEKIFDIKFFGVGFPSFEIIRQKVQFN